jgi:hypothetical protein
MGIDLRRRNSFLAVGIVFLVLTAFMFMEAQSVLGATGYTMNVSYKIIYEGSPNAAPVIDYVTPEGAHSSSPIPLYPDSKPLLMGKNTAWSVTPPTGFHPVSEERYYSTGLTGTTKNSGSIIKVFEFQHQFYLNVVSDHDTPSGSKWYNSGATAYAQLSRDTVQGTTGTRYVFKDWATDASGTHLKSNVITMNAPKTATANWITQYQITYGVNPAYSGSTEPSGTHYYNSGSSTQIKATSSANAFVAWTQKGTITIASPSETTTTAIINGPGKITANFATATQNPTHLTVKCVPAEVGINQQTIISGFLTDKNNDPLVGKTIIFTWSPIADSLGWTGIGQATTDAQGYYEFSWTTNIPVGSYFVMAQFEGDTTNRCNSAVASNGDTSLVVVPEYALGALLALGACFASFIAFKKRSSLPHLNLH